MAKQPREPIGQRRREGPPSMSHHDPAHARALLRQGMERHGCATTRLLAEKLGVPHGPRLLAVVGYRGAAGAAWQELARDLEGEPDRPATGDVGQLADDEQQGA